MFGKKTIHERKSLKAATLMMGFFIAAVAALFLMSFTTPAASEGMMTSLKGEVVAVDTFAGTITVKPFDTGLSYDMNLDGTITFTIDNMTSVMSCGQNKPLEYIGAGEKVTINYHEKEGTLFADAIDVSIPLVVACYQ